MRTQSLPATCAAFLVVSNATAAETAMQPAGFDLGNSGTELILLREPRQRTERTTPEQAHARVAVMQQQQARELYAPLFAELRFNEPQIDALTSLIAQHTTLTTSWSSGGVHFTPKAADEQLAHERLSQIQSSLGPEGFEKFGQYRETLAERFQLRRLVHTLNAVGRPRYPGAAVAVFAGNRGPR